MPEWFPNILWYCATGLVIAASLGLLISGGFFMFWLLERLDKS